jgi:hypothetical protein
VARRRHAVRALTLARRVGDRPARLSVTARHRLLPVRGVSRSSDGRGTAAVPPAAAGFTDFARAWLFGDGEVEGVGFDSAAAQAHLATVEEADAPVRAEVPAPGEAPAVARTVARRPVVEEVAAPRPFRLSSSAPPTGALRRTAASPGADAAPPAREASAESAAVPPARKAPAVVLPSPEPVRRPDPVDPTPPLPAAAASEGAPSPGMAAPAAPTARPVGVRSLREPPVGAAAVPPRPAVRLQRRAESRPQPVLPAPTAVPEAAPRVRSGVLRRSLNAVLGRRTAGADAPGLPPAAVPSAPGVRRVVEVGSSTAAAVARATVGGGSAPAGEDAPDRPLARLADDVSAMAPDPDPVVSATSRPGTDGPRPSPAATVEPDLGVEPTPRPGHVSPGDPPGPVAMRRISSSAGALVPGPGRSAPAPPASDAVSGQSATDAIAGGGPVRSVTDSFAGDSVGQRAAIDAVAMPAPPADAIIPGPSAIGTIARSPTTVGRDGVEETDDAGRSSPGGRWAAVPDAPVPVLPIRRPQVQAVARSVRVPLGAPVRASAPRLDRRREGSGAAALIAADPGAADLYEAFATLRAAPPVSTTPSTPPMLLRETDADAPAPPPASASAPAAPPAPASAGGAPPPPGSDPELLYEEIVRRLKRDLLVERERHGDLLGGLP